MPTQTINFNNAECSACHKKHIDIKTEIVAPSSSRPKAIRKKIFFRCEEHLNCDADEVEKLALVKVQFQDLKESNLVDGKTFLKQLNTD
ncbi:hypothetical protein [Pseudoalteromonas sp. APC 3694]|uniref:hypothetical protein n=1 Tax=Pseudoalteromonas sp. APC 3694 TaxID=3035202 RepID=UPI0025B5C2EB|nr:hypothetical protein [Pseudoalteromonas sp. APC 3694]MDN3491055.1 hypothetical protein [Pseudoalteromonas sp. APC 3694]